MEDENHQKLGSQLFRLAGQAMSELLQQFVRMLKKLAPAVEAIVHILLH